VAVGHEAFVHAGHKEQRCRVPRQFQPPFEVERFALTLRLDAALAQTGEQDVGAIPSLRSVRSGCLQFAQTVVKDGDGLLKGRVGPARRVEQALLVNLLQHLA